MRQTILYHSNILGEGDLAFINDLAKQLENIDISLVLVGWNEIDSNWNLVPHYHKLPENIECLEPLNNIECISEEFADNTMSLKDLIDRFTWWFSNPKNLAEKHRRIAFLHYHLHLYKSLFKKYNPSLVLVWNGNDPRQYIFNAIASSFGTEKLFIERGPLPSVFFYDRSGVLANSTLSNIEIDTIVKHSYKNECFDNYRKWYQQSSETLWEQPEKHTDKDLKTVLGLPNNQKVTLFIGQVDNDVQSKLFSPYFNSNLEAFEWFINNARKSGYFVLGKHHPKSKISIDQYRAVFTNQNDVVWSDQFSLNECLELADNIVSVNSSVMFDALLHKKPVLSLGISLLSGKEITYDYTPEQTDIIVNEFYGLVNFKQRLLRFEKIMDYMFINNLIFLNEVDAVNRFSSVLLKSTKRVPYDEDINFDFGVIDSYNRQLQSFSTNNEKWYHPVTNYLSAIETMFKKIKRLRYLISSLNSIVKERDNETKMVYGLSLHRTSILKVERPELITIGHNCSVGPYSVIYVQNYSTDFDNSYLKIGDSTTIGEFSNIRACGGTIKIGNKVQIAQNVNLIASNHLTSNTSAIREQPWDENKNFIEIGDDVWIGCGVTILPGSKIGSGAVIGANTLVNSYIPENTIVAGNPNKILRTR